MAVADLEKSRHSESVTEEPVPHTAMPRQEDSSDFTEEEWALDKEAVRRLDWTLLPLCAIAYLLNFLDRSNFGNAKVAGMQKDLGLSTHQYLVCLTMTYVLYITFEFPSNMLLKRVGANILIPAMIIGWGTVCCLTGFAESYHGLLIARLFLGFAESGLFPGLVLYLSMFYRRRELQTRISLFFSAASLSGAFSGLLAAAIINLDGKGAGSFTQGWRWIFFLEGAITILFGIILIPLLPATPETARFLTPVQRAHIARRLRLDSPAGANDFDEKFSWAEARKSATSPHVIFLFIALFGNGITLYGFSYFTPTIVGTFGYNTVQTQLLTVPPYVLAFLLTMINAYLSDRFGARGICAIAMSLLALVGYIIFYKTLTVAGRYTALFLAISGVYSTSPALVTWLPNNSAGHYRKATSVALGFIATNSGGIASTWLFDASSDPHYYKASEVLIGMTCMIILFCTINLVYLRHVNAKKALQRAEDEKYGKHEISGQEWAEQGDKHAHFVYSY
ncbi:hypothetical protein JCM8097_004805 [Rhodosporidiobolus ruineniae]